MPDVFISYSRKDKEFAEKLVKSLEADGRDVWIDFEDIPFASEWWEEICQGIEASENAVFILSPDSLESKVCGLEVNYALSNHKRLIPIVYREPDQIPVPQEISHLNWIHFTIPEVFDDSYRKLIETFDTDLDLLRHHTRLLMRAKDWEKKGHSPSLLLRGDELDEMDDMLAQPDITDLQRNFLEKSLQRNRRVQILLRFLYGFLGGFLGIGFWAFSVFRSDILITPLRLIYTLALGQVFGLFTGIQSILIENLPLWLERRISHRLHVGLRIIACFVLSVMAWSSYHWFLDSFDLTPQDINTLLFGGIGLALGFIIRILFRQIPAWLATLLMAVFTWIPIYVTFTEYRTQADTFLPLIQFDNPNHVFTVAVPIVLLIAIGANAQALAKEGQVWWKQIRARGGTKVETANIPA